MSATALNFAMTRGDTVTLALTYTADGDITGASITMTARDKDDGVVFTRKNVAAGGDASQCAITSAAAGQFSIYLVAANGATLAGKTGTTHALRHDVQLTLATGEIRTAFEGTITVTMDATR